MNSYTVAINLQATDNASPTFNRVQDEIRQTGTTVNESGNAVEGFGGKMRNLGNIVTGVGAAFAGLAIVQKIGELNEIGSQANKAEGTFTQLAGAVGDAGEIMAALRSRTGGVVDDMTLMAGANRLLLTGLASTSEEIAGFTELAVKLGGAMGQDAASAVENFNAAILNMSYERLDTLGISAGKVRERVAELKLEGYATDEAFKMAVLEQGRVAIERLGPAAEASATGLGKLQTRIQNMTQDLGQFVSNGVNAAATSLDQLIQLGQIATGTHEIQQQQQAEARAFAESNIQVFADAMGEAFSSQMGNSAYTDVWSQWLMSAYDAVKANPALLDSREQLMSTLMMVPENIRGEAADAIYSIYEQQSITQASQAASQLLSDQAEAMAEANVSAYWDSYTQYWGAYADPTYQRQNQIMQQAGISQAQVAAGTERLAQVQRQAELNRGYDAYTQMWRQQQDRIEQEQADAAERQAEIARQMRDDMRQDAQADAEAFGQLFEDAGRFISNSDMTALNESFLSIQNAFDAGLIPESEYSRLKEMADEAARMNEELMSIDLSGLFGQTDGGLQGQMTDSVIAQMRASGRSDEEIAAMERQLNLQSGRETAASVAYQEQIVPMLATMSPQDAAQAIQNLDALVKAAMEMDLNPDQIAMLLNSPGAIGFGAGMNFNVNPGDTVTGIAGQTGLPIDAIMRIAGISDPRMLQVGSYGGPGMMASGPYDPYALINGMFSGQGLMASQDAVAGGPGSGVVDPTEIMESVSVFTDAAAVSAQTFTENLTTAVTEAETIVSTLDIINVTPYVAQIDVKVNDPTGALAIILNGMTLGTFAGGSSNRDNGGRAGGVDNRVGGRAGSTPSAN